MLERVQYRIAWVSNRGRDQWSLTAAVRDFIQGEHLHPACIFRPSPVLPPAPTITRLGMSLDTPLPWPFNTFSGSVVHRFVNMETFFCLIFFLFFFFLYNTIIIYMVCELPCLALPVQKPLRRVNNESVYCYKLQFAKWLSNSECLRYDSKGLNAQEYKHLQSEFQATLKEPHIVSRSRGSQSSHNFQEF